MNFEFNDCDVCLNPEIIFHFMNKRAIENPYGVISNNVKFHFDKLVEWENKKIQLTLF